jgi:hypothetical protein
VRNLGGGGTLFSRPGSVCKGPRDLVPCTLRLDHEDLLLLSVQACCKRVGGLIRAQKTRNQSKDPDSLDIRALQVELRQKKKEGK